jgi:hypothetical protein
VLGRESQVAGTVPTPTEKELTTNECKWSQCKAFGRGLRIPAVDVTTLLSAC